MLIHYSVIMKINESCYGNNRKDTKFRLMWGGQSEKTIRFHRLYGDPFAEYYKIIKSYPDEVHVHICVLQAG